MGAINHESFHKKDYGSAGKEREILRSSDLNKLIAALLICMESYLQLAEATIFWELKAVYRRFAEERAAYMAVLYLRLGQNSDLFIDKEGGLTGQIEPAWAIASFINNEAVEDEALLNSIINNELTAIKNYDDYLRNHIPEIKDLNLLISQQNSIKQVVKGL